MRSNQLIFKEMVYTMERKEEFSSAHRLHSSQLSQEDNFAVRVSLLIHTLDFRVRHNGNWCYFLNKGLQARSAPMKKLLNQARVL